MIRAHLRASPAIVGKPALTGKDAPPYLGAAGRNKGAARNSASPEKHESEWVEQCRSVGEVRGRQVYLCSRDMGPVLNQKKPAASLQRTARPCLNKGSRQSGGLHMHELRGQIERKHAGSKGLGGQHKGGDRLARTAPYATAAHVYARARTQRRCTRAAQSKRAIGRRHPRRIVASARGGIDHATIGQAVRETVRTEKRVSMARAEKVKLIAPH